jgi:uncharacterized protein (DUF58 family)
MKHVIGWLLDFSVLVAIGILVGNTHGVWIGALAQVMVLLLALHVIERMKS